MEITETRSIGGKAQFDAGTGKMKFKSDGNNITMDELLAGIEDNSKVVINVYYTNPPEVPKARIAYPCPNCGYEVGLSYKLGEASKSKDCPSCGTTVTVTLTAP